MPERSAYHPFHYHACFNMSEGSSAFVAASSQRECKIILVYIGFSFVKGHLPYSCKKQKTKKKKRKTIRDIRGEGEK